MKLTQAFQDIQSIVRNLPETDEAPHFEKIAFRVKGKIFATYSEQQNTLTIKLSEIEQSVFVSADPISITPVANKWGKQGWTVLLLSNLQPDLLKDALISSYCTVAPKKLADTVRDSL